MYSQFKSQRNQDFDIIVVDDGSTDRSTEILQEALKSYDKDVHFIQLQENTGHAHARNVALEQAHGQYVLFLDADDQLASYAVDYYLQHVNGLDTLIAPIHKFRSQRPQYVDKDKSTFAICFSSKSPNAILRKESACNILFKMPLLKRIRFNLMNH